MANEPALSPAPPRGLTIHPVVAIPPPLPASCHATADIPALETPPAAPPKAPEPTVDAPSDERSFSRIAFRLPAWLASLVFHLSLVLVMAMLTTIGNNSVFTDGNGSGPLTATAYDRRTIDEMERIELEDVAIERASVEEASQFPDALAIDAAAQATAPFESPAVSVPTLHSLEADLLGGAALGPAVAPGSSLEARGNAMSRQRRVILEGGTPGSERSVASALAWLAAHQSSDGSWSFDLKSCPKCRARRQLGAGRLSIAKNAATAMALLPFFGTGQTHKDGEYKQRIQKGLYYLTRSMQETEVGGSLYEPGGRMYAHGLAAIVLCEAYGMTRDSALKGPAQSAVRFIEAAQDANGGGWRYEPGQAGDTSVVGWQLMALKSAEMAYLNVDTQVVRKVEYYLDSVQSQEGALYGYTGPGEGPATSAIGLLCRMYLGRKPDHPAQKTGIATLSRWGPSTDTSGPARNNMYYNYYATQVLHHAGGYPWKEWNEVMREYLIRTQVSSGRDKGSWHLTGSDQGADAGGRLYCTAMAAMVLEVYYRHMPLYRHQSTKNTFGR